MAPSVVATIVETAMNTPRSATHGSVTECTYQARSGSQLAVLIRFDTNSSEKAFASDRSIFESHGQKLGQVTGFGDEAYYFSETAGKSTVNTIVVRQGRLQILVTGSAALDQTAAIAHQTLTEYEAAHPSVIPTTPTT